MTVFEYIELRKKELDEFAEDWEKSRLACPSNWPNTLDEYEWYEHELAFNDMQGKGND